MPKKAMLATRALVVLTGQELNMILHALEGELQDDECVAADALAASLREILTGARHPHQLDTPAGEGRLLDQRKKLVRMSHWSVWLTPKEVELIAEALITQVVKCEEAVALAEQLNRLRVGELRHEAGEIAKLLHNVGAPQ